MIYSHYSPCPFGALMGTLSGAQSRAQSAFPQNRFEKTTKAEFTRQKLAHMITRGAKEYPETIPSEIQGGRPLHFLRLLSWYPLLEYGTSHYDYYVSHLALEITLGRDVLRPAPRRPRPAPRSQRHGTPPAVPPTIW